MGRALEVRITLSPGGAIFSRQFTRFASELTDLSPAFEEMADAFGQWEAQAFSSGGSSSGGGWAPKKDGGASHLTRSGRLRGSLTGPSIRRIGPKRMELGTGVPYARYHQTGTSRMVARPVIRLTAANKAQWTKIIHRFILKASTGRGA